MGLILTNKDAWLVIGKQYVQLMKSKRRKRALIVLLDKPLTDSHPTIGLLHSVNESHPCETRECFPFALKL